ncbi:MAG: helix-turn-helix domain-containing protein [Acidobacteriota bacterium]|nr:helix-turn-helix domain-containing protein [Acidobacteriota bacterium]MDQ3920270.1 helix-turn-helix domain-containing protein [Acidobacteriota bacterium]
MAHRTLQNYLRIHRRRAGFSQQEVAFLLGVLSKGKVSRYEHYTRQPRLHAVFAYELIFGVPARDLFAGLFQMIERRTINRAVLLASRLRQGKAGRVTARKLELLDAIIVASNKRHKP